MTAVEIENKISDLNKEIGELNKLLRVKKINDSLLEKGDIFKDKWIRIGSLLFYSKGCVSGAKAYDTREYLENNTGEIYFLFEFHGFRLMFHDTFGIKFTGYDDMSDKPFQDVIKIKVEKRYLTPNNFQIIDKNDIEELNKITNEIFIQDNGNYKFSAGFSAGNDICDITINPNVKIEIKNERI